MSVEQREFLLLTVRDRSCWHMYESVMLWLRRGSPHMLDVSDVLEAVCKRLMSSKVSRCHDFWCGPD